jgi:hypothetical protein
VGGSSNVERKEGFFYEVTTQQQALAHVASTHAQISDTDGWVYNPTVFTCEVEQEDAQGLPTHIHFQANDQVGVWDLKWGPATGNQEHSLPKEEQPKQVQVVHSWGSNDKQRVSEEWVAEELKFEGGQEGAPLRVSLKLNKLGDSDKKCITTSFEVLVSDQGFSGYKVGSMRELFLHAFEEKETGKVQLMLVFPQTNQGSGSGLLKIECALNEECKSATAQFMTSCYRQFMSVGDYPYLLEGLSNTSELLATTLVRNEPQKVIEIAPYELLNFVEIGAKERTDFIILARENTAVWDFSKANSECTHEFKLHQHYKGLCFYCHKPKARYFSHNICYLCEKCKK